MDRQKRNFIYEGARIWVNANVFDDTKLPIAGRSSYRHSGKVYGIVLSATRESCTVNWDDNEITSVSKKFVNEFFGERSDSLLEEKNTPTDESILGDTFIRLVG